MCNCKNIEIGSYKNQVELTSPKHMKKYRNNLDKELSETICVDKCLEEEIKYLWLLGITTTGCCCGHNKTSSYIGVIPKDIKRMKNLGYEVRFNSCRPNDEDSFISKTII
jgi:hypothetical protein